MNGGGEVGPADLGESRREVYSKIKKCGFVNWIFRECEHFVNNLFIICSQKIHKILFND